MVQTILVIAAIAAFLLLLFLLCRRFPILGDGLAFVCILASRLLVKLQWFAEAAATLFAKVAQASLTYPPHVTDDVWSGVYVIARILLFVVCSIILTGDLYNTLQSTPLLFGGAGAVDLPGSFVIPSALLFVMLGALYGIIGLDCANVTPYGAHLFPEMTTTVKKWLGISCFAGFLLSLVFAVLFWAFRGWFLSDPDNATILAIPILALVGLLLTGASVLALWGLVVGLTGILTVVFWLAYCICTVAAGVFSFIPAFFDVLAVHLSSGERTVYERYLPGLPYQVPNAWFHQRASVSRDGRDQQISSPSSRDEQTPVNEFAIATHTENEVQPMHTGFVGITLNGVLGSQMVQSIQVSFASCKKLVRASGRVNPLQLAAQRVGLGLDCSAATYDQMSQKLVEAFLGVADAPFLLHVLDMQDGVNAVQMLRDVHRRLPHSIQVVLTAISHAELERPAVQAFHDAFAQLHHEGSITTTVLFGTDSPRVRSFGDVKFHEYVARVLADLVVAPTHSSNNLSAGTVFSELARTSAFVSLALDTAAVASGETKKQWVWLKWFTKKAVIGSLEDMLTQAFAVTNDILEKDEKSAYDQPVSSTMQCYLLHDVPLSCADRRFRQFEERNNQQIKQHFPNAHTITISGNPVSPVFGSSSPFRIGVSCLYPVALPIVDEKHASRKEENDKHEEPAESVSIAADTFVANGNTSRKNGRGRPQKKEQ